MNNGPLQETFKKPTWTYEVDQLLEFTDTAIDDPAELAAIPKAAGPRRAAAALSNQLTEFTEKAVNQTTDTNGVPPE